MAGILLFGGTEEGHRLAEELCRRGAQVTVSVATGYGRELLRDVPCTRILAGRLGEEEMIRDPSLCCRGIPKDSKRLSKDRDSLSAAAPRGCGDARLFGGGNG